MTGDRRTPQRVVTLTFYGATFAAVVLAAVLIPLCAQNLLASHQMWPVVLATPFIAVCLLTGIVAVPLINERLGFAPLSFRSVLVHVIYLGCLFVLVALMASM